MMNVSLSNEQDSEAFGKRFARFLLDLETPLFIVYLHGELGAGKTTLARAILRGLGHQGSVKSPTYTLVEEYDIERIKAFHFDLYRLADPEELEFMGMRDFLNPSLSDSDLLLCFIEWPERGEGLLPKPDLELNLLVEGSGRRCEIEFLGVDTDEQDRFRREVICA